VKVNEAIVNKTHVNIVVENYKIASYFYLYQFSNHAYEIRYSQPSYI